MTDPIIPQPDLSNLLSSLCQECPSNLRDGLSTLPGWWDSIGDPGRAAAVGTAFGAALLVRMIRGPERAPLETAVLPPVGRVPLLERPVRHYDEPLRIGSSTVEGREVHVGIVATTGGFKTTVMAQLARQTTRPIVVLVGGDADQLEMEVRAKGGWVWRPRHGVPLNVFPGSGDYSAQAWEHIYPQTTSDAGVLRGAFREVAAPYFDQAGSQRSLPGLIAALEAHKGGRLAEAMKEAWLMRLKPIQRTLGDSLGADGLELNAALARGASVMFALDSFEDPALINHFAALIFMVISNAVRTRGGFDLFVDELGRLPKALLTEAARTFRRNKVRLRAASQSSEDFDEQLTDLMDVWLLGRLTGAGHRTRTWASRATFGTVAPENFGRHSLGRLSVVDRILRRGFNKGYFYMVADGRVELIQVPKYQAPQFSRGPIPLRDEPPESLYQPSNPVTPQYTESVGNVHTVEQPPQAVVATTERRHSSLGREGPPSMPEFYRGTPAMSDTDRKALLRFWLNHVFKGLDGCWESTYRPNTSGRRQGSFRNQLWTTYILTRSLADGLGDNLSFVRMLTSAGELTVDHLCENENCDRVEHLAWEGRGANSELFHARRKTADEDLSLALDEPEPEVEPELAPELETVTA